MSLSKRRATAFSAPILLVSLALLAGCGGAGAAADAPTATAPAVPTATATPSSLPALPTVQVTSGACGQYVQYGVPYTPAGGLAVTQTSKLGNLAYPAVQIPSDQSAQPIPEPSTSSGSVYGYAELIVNPNVHEGGGGYVLTICNTSSKAHVVSAVQASIARITPYTGQLNAWEPCSGVYHPGATGISGGCGGGDSENEYLHAPFAPDAPVGTSVTTTLTGSNLSDASNDVNLGPLPVTLQPGQAMTVEIGVTQPSAPGYYTYAFALTVDGASTGVVAYSLETLLAPVARAWSGQGCLSAAMQAQISQAPTPTANRGFICPES